MTECATCGVDDQLLFTCEHCDGQFCSAHELPHHACAHFTRNADASDRPGTAEADGWEFGDESAVVTSESTTEPATIAAVERKPTQSEQPDPEPARTTATGTTDTRPESVPFVVSDRDAAKECRPDRETHWVRPPGKGLPHERGGEHPVFTWMREQSYPGYVAKVGSLSLVLTCSYYIGFVAVTYGLPL